MEDEFQELNQQIIDMEIVPHSHIPILYVTLPVELSVKFFKATVVSLKRVRW